MTQFDEQFDFVITGSGAGSMVAALYLRSKGKSVLVLEKTELVGGSLDETVKKMLSTLILTGKQEGVDDDKVFGIAEPQAVGARWPVNAELAIRDARRTGIGLLASTFQGTTELVSVDKAGDQELMEVSAELSGELEPGSMIPFPPEGVKVESRFNGSYSALLPVDTTQASPVENTTQMNIRSVMEQQIEGQTMVTEYALTQEKKEIYSAAP